jgi:tetratricopeptide (TPR) repeat protein
MLLASLPSVSNAEAWELRTAPDAVPGTHEIESGKIDKAIRISKVWLPHIARREKVAVLTNLCIGYILSKEFDQAEEYCDRAAERPNARTVSYNNRGVLKALQGDYEGAVQDFANASNAGCADRCSKAGPRDLQQPRAVAMRNFGRAEYHVKAAKTGNDDQIAARTN